jgi:hypothetical protein
MYRELRPNSSLTLNSICPLCGAPAYEDNDPHISASLVICLACGKYRLRHMASELAGLNQNPKRYLVSHRLRSIADASLRGKPKNSSFPIYDSEDFKKMLESSDYPVSEKLNLLLSHLGHLSDHPGDLLRFDIQYDYSVLSARNYSETSFYLQALDDQNLITRVAPDSSQNMILTTRFGENGQALKVTARGWAELERLRQLGAESSNGFIAMWFDPSRKPFDNAITQAIEAAGYLPIRIDRVEHVNRIDDEIIARIRQAKFLVGDFTNQNKGVYFEAGFMLGLGRPVFWVCEKEDLKNVHFDTRQYNTIDYESPEDLKARLQVRIEALFGAGPNRDQQTVP